MDDLQMNVVLPRMRSGPIKKLNRRGRGERRDQNGQKLKARMQGEKGPSFSPCPEGQNYQWLSRNDLCALCFLFVHPLVWIPGGSKGKEKSVSIKSFVFFVFTKKKLCGLCALCGLFFLPPRRAQRLI
jgi:hypothetical protein